MENKKPTVLKNSSDFLRIKSKGKRKNPCAWMLFAYAENDLGHLRYGWTLSRKVGPAVTRNRIKRWCREYFRKVAIDGFNPEIDINVVLKPMPSEFYKKLEHSVFVENLDRAFKMVAKKP